MSEAPSTSTPPAGGTPPAEAPPAFAPIKSQEDFDRAVSERLARQRAQFADHDKYKAAAAKLDEIEAASKSELEKAADRAVKAEKERDDTRSELLRLKVASSKGIPPDLADRLRGGSEDELNADADRLLAVIGNGGRAPAAFDHGARQTAPPSSMNDVITSAIQSRR